MIMISVLGFNGLADTQTGTNSWLVNYSAAIMNLLKAPMNIWKSSFFILNVMT
jgi:hypothetical protein